LTQIILNPKSVKDSDNLNTWEPEYPIPNAVREWGYCPNFNDWLPGDLILVSAIKPNFIVKAIWSIQKKGGYSYDDARWEHAAVYIGSGALCEASTKGVRIRTIFDYTGSHLIRIRRNSSLTNDQRWEIAVNALKQNNYKYNYFSIIDILWKAKIGFWNGQGKAISFPKRAVICSELYADAHVKVCSVALGNLRSGEITPASLSMDKALTDVQTNWLKICSP
jgi:hypothetical protein